MALVLRAQGYPLSLVPTFDLDFQTCNVDLTEVRGHREPPSTGREPWNCRSLHEAAAAGGYIEDMQSPFSIT
jgi:hypothetical protein